MALIDVFLSMLCLWLVKGWLVLQSCLIYSFASRKRVSWGYSFTSSNDLFGSSWVTCKDKNEKIGVSRLLWAAYLHSVGFHWENCESLPSAIVGIVSTNSQNVVKKCVIFCISMLMLLILFYILHICRIHHVNSKKSWFSPTNQHVNTSVFVKVNLEG